MEAPSFLAPIQFPLSFRYICSNSKPSPVAAKWSIKDHGILHFHLNLKEKKSHVGSERSKIVAARDLGEIYPSATVKKVLRRSFLQFLGFNQTLINVYGVVAAPMQEAKEPEVIRTQKLDSGVWLQEIFEGEGTEAHEGDLVEVNYVCRRSNGYFMHSTVNQFSGESTPVILPLDDGQTIRGLKEVLIGMKVGGKRRALIPPSLGYTNVNLRPIPDEFGPRRRFLTHANEPLVFEVQLLKVL